MKVAGFYPQPTNAYYNYNLYCWAADFSFNTYPFYSHASTHSITLVYPCLLSAFATEVLSFCLTLCCAYCLSPLRYPVKHLCACGS